jgi:hypothetical protein
VPIDGQAASRAQSDAPELPVIEMPLVAVELPDVWDGRVSLFGEVEP